MQSESGLLSWFRFPCFFLSALLFAGALFQSGTFRFFESGRTLFAEHDSDEICWSADSDDGMPLSHNSGNSKPEEKEEEGQSDESSHSKFAIGFQGFMRFFHEEGREKSAAQKTKHASLTAIRVPLYIMFCSWSGSVPK
jgi:hypothetical protein